MRLVASRITKLQPKVETKADEEYQALASKLGLSIGDSDVVLSHILHDNAIAIYDLEAVSNYLKTQAPANHKFAWVPIRRQLIPRVLMERFPARVVNHWTWSEESKNGHIASRTVYKKAIPYPVLQTIDTITEAGKKAGIEPTFFISDFVRERAVSPSRRDPFLAVGTSDSNALYVVERWDEPGFREETYSSRRKKEVVGKK